MNANEMISPEEQAEEQIEVHVEDHGIGHYEFWGSKEFDSRPCLALTNSEIMVQYDDTWECIELYLQGTTTDDEGYMQLEWKASLNSVTYNSKDKCWDATYEVWEI